ncbi:MAG TPA: ABC-2 family transporter protein [Bacilli bacterium]|nr:ABC-2 family transporter protein [Bacilli bacterium]
MNYIKLYFTCIKRSMISRLEYKKDTFVALFSFLFSNLCALLSIFFILQTIPALEGYSLWEVGFFYGFSMIPISLDHLFSDEFWLVAYRRVKEGDMDMYFLRPVPVMFQVFAETFQPEGFGEMILGTALIVACSFNITFSVSVGTIIMIVVASVFGAMIITSLKIIFSSFAFIFKDSGPLLQIIYNFTNYAKYPLKIYPKFLRLILIFILPFGLFISLPVDTLINGTYNPCWISLAIIGGSIAFFFLAVLIWSICIKKYESTGS